MFVPVASERRSKLCGIGHCVRLKVTTSESDLLLEKVNSDVDNSDIDDKEQGAPFGVM